jgi:hypothetical protein
MSKPSVNVLGVYRLDVTDELVREQHSILLPGRQGHSWAASEQQVRDQIETLGSRWVILRKSQPSLPRDEWQATWAEAYLSLDGSSLAVGRWSPTPVCGDLRIAFFMHFWQPTDPLQSSYGEIVCPQPHLMPDRLRKLVPFEPVG